MALAEAANSSAWRTLTHGTNAQYLSLLLWGQGMPLLSLPITPTGAFPALWGRGLLVRIAKVRERPCSGQAASTEDRDGQGTAATLPQHLWD